MSQGSDHQSQLRLHQEREIALDHVLASSEYALALEAAMIGYQLERAGITADPTTLIALRILESASAERVDSAGCLRAMIAQGVVDRSVALTRALLDDAA